MPNQVARRSNQVVKSPVLTTCACFHDICAIFLYSQISFEVQQFSDSNYRPQTNFAKVMFLQVSVCPRGGLWQGACAWWGCVWQGACIAGSLYGKGAMRGDGGGCVWHARPPPRYYGIRSMSGRYASYWNAFLLNTIIATEILPCVFSRLQSSSLT